MKHPPDSKGRTPQAILRTVVELCADCDTCRTLMDVDCLFFPELYRLWDQEQESGVPIAAAEWRSLVNLCTLCGICPCPKIPADLMLAKSCYIDAEGLPLATRLLTDVPRFARLGGTFPTLINSLEANKAISSLVKKVIRVHSERQLLTFPQQNFFQWAAQQGLTTRREGGQSVAYFAGCSAGYLFPQIGMATVAVLERNGLTVHVPPQQCCGMPHLVEGDRTTALQRLQFNMGQLLASTKSGAAIICSCPTCGYLMKILLKERACYSAAYQRSVHAGEDEIKVPTSSFGAATHKILRKSMYKEILKDDGYFASLDPMARLDVACQLADAGEYLGRLHAEGRLNTDFTPLSGRMVYFAPCHQREQNIGSPYPELLGLIPGIIIERLEGMYCCGMGGNFGFKADFHAKSLEIGRPLMDKIRELAPAAIITDCMSCRLQFNHALPYPVFHPLEILARACKAGEEQLPVLKAGG